jgi:protein-disulfide isomerase
MMSQKLTSGTSSHESGKFAVPIAIVVAGVLIAGALYLNGKRNDNVLSQEPVASNPDGQANFRPIDKDDHLIGNPNAPVIILEYSDTECEFCKNFHQTMTQILDHYGKDGSVAWVYRHFPVHQKSRHEAEAVECAAEIGGNQGFWKYLDTIFAVTPSNDGLDEKLLPQIAKDAGIDVRLFEACLESGRHADEVQDDFDDAVRAGAQGTPHNVLIAGNNILPIPGAQTYASLKSAIDLILDQVVVPGATPQE